MDSIAPTDARSRKRIAVLFHSGHRYNRQGGYIVDHLAQFWREDGHEVVYLYGTRHYLPADLLFVHVDLSVVPEKYLAFAARYPRVVNGRIRDIRKSVISGNLLRQGDPWTGQVIVKTDLNCGGMPEQILLQSWLHRRSNLWRRVVRRARSITGSDSSINSWRNYLLFDRLSDVPEQWFHDRQVVVERFCPEVESGLYRLRMFQFLGDRWSCVRLASKEPIIKAESGIHLEPIEPDPAVTGWRDRLGMEYGKLDYVVHDNTPVLLDVNKTTSASTHIADDQLRLQRRHLAEGLYAYFSRSCAKS
jgi:hypothetical protein